MKLVAAQAQGLNLANLTLAKPVSLRTIGKPHVSGSVSVLQPKQVLIRKLATPTKGMQNIFLFLPNSKF